MLPPTPGQLSSGCSAADGTHISKFPTCQWLLLPHVPYGDSLPRAAGQDAIRRGVELQHIHGAPAGPQRQPRAAGHVLAALGQAPNLHLRPPEDVGQTPGG